MTVPTYYAGNLPIEIEEGSNWAIQLYLKQTYYRPIDLTGYEVYMNIRTSVNGSTVFPNFGSLPGLSSLNGLITFDDRANGVITLALPAGLTVGRRETDPFWNPETETCFTSGEYNLVLEPIFVPSVVARADNTASGIRIVRDKDEDDVTNTSRTRLFTKGGEDEFDGFSVDDIIEITDATTAANNHFFCVAGVNAGKTAISVYSSTYDQRFKDLTATSGETGDLSIVISVVKGACGATENDNIQFNEHISRTGTTGLKGPVANFWDNFSIGEPVRIVNANAAGRIYPQDLGESDDYDEYDRSRLSYISTYDKWAAIGEDYSAITTGTQTSDDSAKGIIVVGDWAIGPDRTTKRIAEGKVTFDRGVSY